MFGNILFGSTPFGGLLGKEKGRVIRKLLRYTIQVEVARERPQLSLQYRARLNYQDKYQPKESEYTGKYPPQEGEYIDKYILRGTKYRKKY